ncbi:MAG: ABC transporter ATP-binding protein [Desulfobacterales bacterium]|nr:ABC transporter ATP-binding protein [Desulfobacterales bacterium]
MIRLENLTKQYGKLKAVNAINLHIKPGEIFGFIGPNGAGKTTTIKMMSGLLSPTAGHVTINGINMIKNPESAKKNIGLIPDRPYLYEKLTGIEFLRFTADLYHIPSDIFKKKADHFLEMFALKGRANELIEAYSHGMKQRLIMSAALLHDPPLVIVDEPMVGLDPRAIKMVRDLFRTLSENGTTVFMSTHTLKLAEEICNRIGIINHGNVIATGSLEELKEAASIGDSNLEEIFFRLTDEGI